MQETVTAPVSLTSPPPSADRAGGALIMQGGAVLPVKSWLCFIHKLC